jgi:NAD-dependent SIR2 family protein deacetylase
MTDNLAEAAIDYHEHLFTCAICEREVRDWKGRSARDKHLPPVCRHCEMTWGTRPSHGAFMDRRVVTHIGALADALSATAWQQHHRRHGYGTKGL